MTSRRAFFSCLAGVGAAVPIAAPRPRLAPMSDIVRDGVSQWVVSDGEFAGERVIVVQLATSATDSDRRRAWWCVRRFLDNA